MNGKNSIHLLYLEDDALDRKAFAHFVEDRHLPYEIRYASSVGEANSFLSKERYDCILADYKLPDGTAMDIANNRHDSPMIMVTAYGENMVALRVTTLGISDYIVKETGGGHLERVAKAIDWVTSVREQPLQVKKEVKILVIEDNKLDARSFERVLSKNPSYHYVFASNLKQSSEILKEEHFDLVIVDSNLPDGTTADILPALKETPFIVVSGTGSQEYVSLAYQQGACDYLVKDVDRFYLKLLPTSIEKTLQTHKIRELKDHFVSYLAHEIRTPLTVIEGTVINLQEGVYGKLSGEQSEIFQTLRRQTERLSHVVTDILSLSRLESGKTKLNLTLFSLRNCAQKALEECENIKRSEIILRNLIPEDLPQIWADETMVFSLLINLLSNGLRFAKNEIKLLGEPVNDHTIQISVVDDGMGIAKEEQHKLFNTFEQVKKVEGKPDTKSTGLGLAICKRIVQMHEGNIWVESSSGEGAKFHFVLSRNLKK